MDRAAHQASRALATAVLAGVAGAWGGPWLLGHRDKAATEPFGYALPEGFEALPPDPKAPARQAWVHAPLGDQRLVPNMTLTHVDDMSAFDDAKLAEIAAGMPAFFAKTKITWTEVRHASIKRRDGAFVGLLEGENEVDEERFRSLQFSFPDGSGASIVTANFPSAEAAYWEPIFEASIEASRGVATRGSAPALWIRAASGGGMAAVAFLLSITFGLAGRRRDLQPSSGPDRAHPALPKGNEPRAS